MYSPVSTLFAVRMHSPTNTSSSTLMRRASDLPTQSVIGTHFFSPQCHEAAGERALEAQLAADHCTGFARKLLNKVVVLPATAMASSAPDAPILFGEAESAGRGATPEQIDG